MCPGPSHFSLQRVVSYASASSDRGPQSIKRPPEWVNVRSLNCSVGPGEVFFPLFYPGRLICTAINLILTASHVCDASSVSSGMFGIPGDAESASRGVITDSEASQILCRL